MNFVVEELIRAILRGPDPPWPQNRRLLDNCSPSTSMKPKRAPSYLGNPKAQLKGMGQSEIQIRPRSTGGLQHTILDRNTGQKKIAKWYFFQYEKCKTQMQHETQILHETQKHQENV